VNRHVNAIAGRLSLRPPQRRSLEILDRITEIAPPRKDTDIQAATTAIQSEFPTVTDFEREFPSLCFALATGVGKTRLMGAFISCLHLAHGINNFFVMAPNLTIYNKLITDFTRTRRSMSSRASRSLRRTRRRSPRATTTSRRRARCSTCCFAAR
jgi:type III restriction enzyme